MVLRRYPAAIVQRIVTFCMRRKPSKGQILMFHQVCDDKNQWLTEECAITQKGFSEFIETLIASGTTFGKLDELVVSVGNTKEKQVWITFDDAYEDVYTNAFPLLQAHGIPFTVFLTVDFLDRENYLKTESVRQMLKSELCTVGAHTVSHRMLSSLDTEEGRREIMESKKRLEQLFGISVDSIAFPFGSVYACKKRHQQNARDAGYKMAFSSINSTLPADANVFFLPRINVNEENYKSVQSR